MRLVGTDMSERSVGARTSATPSTVVPAGSDPEFAPAIRRDLPSEERVDAVLPQSSFDLPGLAEARDRFQCSRARRRRPTRSAARTTRPRATRCCDRIGVPAPEWRRVQGGEAVAAAARELGYPDEDVCFKPVFSSGSRGFRVLSASADRREQLLTNRPGRRGARCGSRTPSSCSRTRAAPSCS